MSLKVKFVRYRNVLLATILEQGDEIKRGDFLFVHNDYTLVSADHIELAHRVLYLNGWMTNKDGLFCSRTYATEEKAKKDLQGFKAAIEAYNASLLPEREQQATDVETVVVG